MKRVFILASAALCAFSSLHASTVMMAAQQPKNKKAPPDNTLPGGSIDPMRGQNAPDEPSVSVCAAYLGHWTTTDNVSLGQGGAAPAGSTSPGQGKTLAAAPSYLSGARASISYSTSDAGIGCQLAFMYLCGKFNQSFTGDPANPSFLASYPTDLQNQSAPLAHSANGLYRLSYFYTFDLMVSRGAYISTDNKTLLKASLGFRYFTLSQSFNPIYQTTTGNITSTQYNFSEMQNGYGAVIQLEGRQHLIGNDTSYIALVSTSTIAAPVVNHNGTTKQTLQMVENDISQFVKGLDNFSKLNKAHLQCLQRIGFINQVQYNPHLTCHIDIGIWGFVDPTHTNFSSLGQVGLSQYSALRSIGFDAGLTITY